MGALKNKCIVMVGTSPDTQGGIASVIDIYRSAGLFQRWPVRYLSSHCDGNSSQKILQFLRAQYRFWKILLSGHLGLLHVHSASRASFWRKLLFIIPALVTRKPVIFHLHGAEFNQFSWIESGWVTRFIIRHTLEKVTRVIALSPEWKQNLAKICPRSVIQVIENPIIPCPTVIRRSRPDCRLLTLGRIGERKGSYDLLEVLVRLKAQYPSVSWLCAGDGELTKARAHADQLQLGNTVQFPGWLAREEAATALREADIYVLPSYNEGLPVSILEAMASGLPIVSTSVGGIPRAINNGVEGYIVAPGDLDSLESRLSALMADASLRQQMGRAARNRINRQFTPEHILPRLEHIYDELGACPLPATGQAISS